MHLSSVYVTQTVEVKDAEKPNPPFQHSCCVTGSSSGDGRNLLPSTCVWQLLSALSWDGPSSGPAEWDLLLSFSCISRVPFLMLLLALPPSEGVKAECKGWKNSAFVNRKIFSVQEWEENWPQECLVTCQWHSPWQAWGAAVGAELTPTLSSVGSSLCWERTWCSKALLAFTGHVPLPADFC